MPQALLEDPAAPLIPPPSIPASLPHPRSVYLKDHVSSATVIPIYTPQQVPLSLLTYLHAELNNEIERGDTYPMDVPMSLEVFQTYWFGTFAAIMILGNDLMLQDGRDWENVCLGTFYVKPNYPGRCNHICNAGFLVCSAARGKGVGKILGETYLEYAPKLGYTYSQFNLVFETNIASCKIWDSLGFKRIGLVKGAGRLKSHAQPVNAIIYGRDLGDDEDYVSEERFDKIRFYLEKGKYPPSADRSEKSRLRSATTHYRLENGKLMLKGKEVVADSQKQYEIAKRLHSINHGGINKTTAMITDKYHWVRIKETVSQVIKNCQECKEHSQAPVIKNDPNPPNTSPRSASSLVTSPPNLTPMMQTFDLNSLPQSTMSQLADMDIPVDPAMMEDVHGLTHHHHHQQHTQLNPQHTQLNPQLTQHTQLAPVAQMHPNALTSMMDATHNTDMLGNPRTSSSAEIARAALVTEEDRAMRDQTVIEHKLFEGLKDYQQQAIDTMHHRGMDLDGGPLS